MQLSELVPQDKLKTPGMELLLNTTENADTTCTLCRSKTTTF